MLEIKLNTLISKLIRKIIETAKKRDLEFQKEEREIFEDTYPLGTLGIIHSKGKYEPLIEVRLLPDCHGLCF